MTYNLITKEDIELIIHRLDRDIKFKEEELPTLYPNAIDNMNEQHEELLLMQKERALIYNLYITLEDNDINAMNKFILARK